MARYYFDIDSSAHASDRVGMNLSNLSQVKHEALRRAAEFASDSSNLQEPGAIIVTVKDDTGEAVMTVRLVCSIEIHCQSLGTVNPQSPSRLRTLK